MEDTHVLENVLRSDNAQLLQSNVCFFSLDLIKTVDAPASIHSASLHPEKDFFVAGGDDFKLYKYDYSSKDEMGKILVALYEYNVGLSNG